MLKCACVFKRNCILTSLVRVYCSVKAMEPSEGSTPDSGSQEVNPVYLQQLRELDIPEEAAKQVGLLDLQLS
uniref:Uncharacterized protein n=1 Tax=Anguilla anguilla TaxID=7936 RepID=A0A0E9RQM1_ANGAN